MDGLPRQVPGQVELPACLAVQGALASWDVARHINHQATCSTVLIFGWCVWGRGGDDGSGRGKAEVGGV